MEEKAASMTPEEMEAYLESIPEWKRGALVVQDLPEEKEAEGLFKRMRGKLGAKIRDTDAYKTYQTSDEAKQL
jgi:hypothetical protein